MAGPCERQALQLTDLDDQILVHVFGFLPLEERLSTVELVCRSFRELSCNAPQLHLCAVVLPRRAAAALVRVRSLAEWLVRRGAAVRSLRMRLGLSIRSADGAVEGDGLDPESEATDAGDKLELMTEALQAVAYCAARGALQDLRLCFETMPACRLSAAMAAALGSLHTLHLEAQGDGVGEHMGGSLEGLLAVVGPLHTMAALRELDLRGEPLHMKPGLRLPPNLTRLYLSSSIEQPLASLPDQLSALSGLRDLSIHYILAPAEQYTLLAPLTALHRLELHWCTLPDAAQLRAVGSLQALILAHTPPHGDDDQVAAELDAALRALQHQLTELRLSIFGYPHAHPWPPALAACTQLRSLALSGNCAQPALPAGDWLAGLRRLAVQWRTAAASLQALYSAAPQLECLGVGGTTLGRTACTAEVLRVLAFAAAHPRMQRVVLDVGDEWRDPRAELKAAAASARESKPGLNVVCAPSEHGATIVAMHDDAELACMHQIEGQ